MAMMHRLDKIITLLCLRKKRRGRGISPIKMKAKGRLNFAPKKIPATQAQLI